MRGGKEDERANLKWGANQSRKSDERKLPKRENQVPEFPIGRPQTILIFAREVVCLERI